MKTRHYHYPMRKLSLIILIVPFALLAALPQPKPAPQNRTGFKTIQRQIGGQAGAGFTLLNVQKITAKNGKAERLIFEVGTREGEPLKGLPGYFNIQNQINPNRIVVDFSQMFASRIDEKFILGVMGKSTLIKNAKVTTDPVDGSLSLAIDLNSQVKMKAIQVPGKKQTAKVVVDIVKR